MLTASTPIAATATSNANRFFLIWSSSLSGFQPCLNRHVSLAVRPIHLLPRARGRPLERQAAPLRRPHGIADEDRPEEQPADDEVLGRAAEVGELHAVPQHRD